MAAENKECDCPTQALWTFPAPGNASLMPDKYPQSSSFKIEQYLETSAHHPPTSGFGAVPLYANDLIEPRWPGDFEVPVALHRSLYCKDCQQKVEDYKAQEEFDWESCYERPGFGGIWSTSFDVMGSGMSKVPVKLDFTADIDTMVCALGFPGTLPGGLSQAFPVFNKKPPPGRGRQLFTSNAPEGMPCEDDEVATHGMYHIIGSMLVLALCVAFLARFCLRKRKQRKALQALMAHSECEGLMDGRKRTGYTDDM